MQMSRCRRADADEPMQMNRSQPTLSDDKHSLANVCWRTLHLASEDGRRKDAIPENVSVEAAPGKQIKTDARGQQARIREHHRCSLPPRLGRQAIRRGERELLLRDESQEPRAKCQEPSAKCQVPGAKSQGPRAKSQQGPRAKSQQHTGCDDTRLCRARR